MDDKRIEFHEILKNGRDTRPEQVWERVGQYYVEKLGYADKHNNYVPMRPFFGVFMAATMGWPDPDDLYLDSDIIQVYIKAWVKYNLGNLPEPYTEKYTDRRNQIVRLLAVSEIVYRCRGYEAFTAELPSIIEIERDE